MRNFRRLLATALAVMMVIAIVPVTAFAANGNANLAISVDKTEVNETGEIVTVTVTNSAMTLSSIAGGIGFDTSKATCLSITGSHNNGTAYLTTTGNESVAATVTASVADANQYGYASFAFAGTDNTSYRAGTVLTATFSVNTTAGATFTLFEDSYGTDGCLIDPVATRTVNYVAVTLSSIAVTTAPTKTAYFTGEQFDASGLVVTGYYSNNTSAAVTGYTLSTPNMTTAGQKTVTVSYMGKTTSFNITVSDPVVTSLTITSMPNKVAYDIGEEFRSKGLVITANYNNGNSVAVTDYTLSGFDSATAGQKTITVSYGGQTTTFTVTVNAPTLSSIAVTANPTKTTYEIGEQLSTAGLVVTGTYSDGSTAAVTGYTVSGFDSTTAGTKTVTVSYGGFSATFNVTVNEAQQQTDPLVLTSVTVSGTTFVPNNVVTVTANTTGGTGDLLYYVSIYRDGKAYRNLNDRTSNVLEYSLPSKGVYTFRVRVKNGDGTYTAWKTSAEVTVVGAPTVVGIPTAFSSQEVGETNTWTVNTTGGVGALRYQMWVLHDGKDYKSIGWKDTNTLDYTFKDYGTYTLKVRVKDSAGNYSAYYTGGSIRVLFPAATITAINVNKETATVGESITWTPVLSGGLAEQQYYYTVYRDGVGVKTVNWTSNSTLTYKPTQAGTYTVRVRVKDKYGKKSSFVTGGEIIVS